MSMSNSELDRQAEDRRRAEERTIADLSSQDSALFQLLGQALKPYRGWMVIALILMLGVSGLNALPPLLLQRAIDGPIADKDVPGLLWIALLYALTALGIFILTYGFTYFLQHAGQRALADLRVRLFDQILAQDNAFFSGTSTGDLVSRLTSDIDTLNAVLSNSIVTILVEGVTLIVIIVVMFALNWRLALLSLCILPLVAVVTWYFRKRIRRSSSGERSALGAYQRLHERASAWHDRRPTLRSRG
jgi:ATP-binding cassette subfamily B multidrug efflux pump